MRSPTDPTVHPVHGEIAASVSYLPEYLHQQPRRVFRAWRIVRRWPGYRAARSTYLRDLRRDPTRNRVRRFGQALVLAAEMSWDVGWLHAHFLHTPASVTRYAAKMRMLPWSASAHAKDVWTTPDWEKREKLADCRWLVTCTRINAEHLTALATAAEQVELLYHGIDLSRFPPPPERRPATRDGSDADNPVVLLSVGRAVAKKGYDVLLEALARLPLDLAWRFLHIGNGPMLDALRRRAKARGLSARITWFGARRHQEVLETYRAADLFVLASRIAKTATGMDFRTF
jgi:glycosyltransferase involved in cell wall biosynthesis